MAVGSRVLLVTALRSSLGLSGNHDGLAVADIRHPDAVETAIWKLGRGGDTIIVTCRQGDADEVRRQLTFTGIRYPGLRTCFEPLPGSPLAVGVVSSLVDDIGSNDDALPWQLSALDHLREHLWSAVWMPKVSGLCDPSPSLAQHVRSWFPGSGFLAVSAPIPAVLKAGKAPITGLVPIPDSALIHSPLSSPTWVVPAITTALSPQSVSEVATVRDQVDEYGSADVIELIAAPVAFHSDSRPPAGSIVTCPACDTRHARTTCPVCQMSTAPDESVAQPDHDVADRGATA